MQSCIERKPTIAVVDNDPYTLEMLSAVIRERFSTFDLVWTTKSGSTAVSRCLDEDICPDLLMVDMSLSDCSGIQVCREIRQSSLRPALLAITSFPLERYATMTADAGAQGIVNKESIATLVKTIEEIRRIGAMKPITLANGRQVRFNNVHDAYAGLQKRTSRKITLTEMEKAILTGCMNGDSYTEIASQLHVAPSTVRSCVHRMNKKLGARNIAHAITIWIQKNSNFIPIYKQ